MAGSDYQYVLEVSNTNSELLGQSLVRPDWLPAIAAARFQSLRSGRPITREERIVPAWHPTYGQPHVAGVRAIVTAEDGVETAADIPLHYFLSCAQAAALPLVASGALKEGERFLYTLKSYPVSSVAQDPADSAGGAVERVSASPVTGPRRIEDLSEIVEADEGAGEQPFPVFIPRRVLEEAGELKERAGAMETGGILIGFLWQDPSSSELFAEVTALLPARHTIPGSTKLTFTSETWADVRAAIDLRAMGEKFLGWLHTHPSRFWCTCTDTEKLQTCPLAREFFSKDDCLLHRAVFSGAQHVAVVLGDRYLAGSWQTTYSAYGWRCGVIESRAFHVLGG